MQRIVYRISSAAALRAMIDEGSRALERSGHAPELPLGEPSEAVHAGAWVLAAFEASVETPCTGAELAAGVPSRRPLCASARVVEGEGGELFARFELPDWQRIERYLSARLGEGEPAEPPSSDAPPPARLSSERPQAMPSGAAPLQALRVVFAGVGTVRAQCLGGVAACVEVHGVEQLEAHVLSERSEARAIDALVLQGKADALLELVQRVRELLPRAPLVCVVPPAQPVHLRALMEAGADDVLPQAVHAAEVAATLLALVRRRTQRPVRSSGVA